MLNGVSNYTRPLVTRSQENCVLGVRACWDRSIAGQVKYESALAFILLLEALLLADQLKHGGRVFPVVSAVRVTACPSDVAFRFFNPGPVRSLCADLIT